MYAVVRVDIGFRVIVSEKVQDDTKFYVPGECIYMQVAAEN